MVKQELYIVNYAGIYLQIQQQDNFERLNGELKALTKKQKKGDKKCFGKKRKLKLVFKEYLML